MRKWPVSEGYVACIECIQIAYRLAVAKDEREQSKAVDELIAKLKIMLDNAKQTFLYCIAKSVLRRSLIISSRMPNADLGKVKNLNNIYLEKSEKYFSFRLMIHSTIANWNYQVARMWCAHIFPNIFEAQNRLPLNH